jgi:hypothetical protein
MESCIAGSGDMSGLGVAEQARRHLHPDPPKKEKHLAEHVDIVARQMRRLEAHGEEFELALAFKIYALKMLMTGKDIDYFDLWGADRGVRARLHSGGCGGISGKTKTVTPRTQPSHARSC